MYLTVKVQYVGSCAMGRCVAGIPLANSTNRVAIVGAALARSTAIAQLQAPAALPSWQPRLV